MAEHGKDTGGSPTAASNPAQATKPKTKSGTGSREQEGGPAAHQPLALPIVNMINMRLGFGRMDSDQTIQPAILNIDILITQVAETTYNQINQLSLTAPLLWKHEFLQIWKTILLYMVQNIQECELIVAPPNRTKLARSLLLPRPLADLVYHLGRRQSQANRIIYDIRASTKPAENIPAWWPVNSDPLSKWQQFLSRAANYYLCTEMPRKFAFELDSRLFSSQ